ncbi:MAG: 2-iminoacetate synthase ThiH, partial [Deltaproteobacteria bacterium]|nr:2-iminoacetate synthase ThiH [Deltaproteobacteria bacterium]
MTTSFYERIASVDHDALGRAVRGISADDVDAVLRRDRPDDADALALFSPAAFGRIEEMARRAAAITERRFGRVIQLYAPMYLSNECANICTYCGFSNDVAIPRVSLTTDQAVREAMHLYEQGFRHILLVTGEYK